MQKEVGKRAPRKKKAEEPEAVEVLTDAVSDALVTGSKDIAESFIKKAKQGDVASTKYLLELAGLKTTKKKKSSAAKRLGKEKAWQPGEAETTESSE